MPYGGSTAPGVPGIDVPLNEEDQAAVDAAKAGVNYRAPTDTSQIDAAGQRAKDLYEQFLRERQSSGNFSANDVLAGKESYAGDVNFQAPGAIERVDTKNRDVTLSPTAQGVSARDVTPVNLGNAMTVNGARIDQAQISQVRSDQTAYLQALKDRMEGRAPSVAEAQQARALQGIADQQTALAGQAHGNQGVFARREAMRNISTEQGKAAMDKALLRATESAGAAGQVGAALQGLRGADQDVAIQQAGLEQGAGLANQSAVNARTLAQGQIEADIATGNANRNLQGQTTTAQAQNQRDVDVAAVEAANQNRGLAAATTDATGANTRAMDVAKTQADVDAANRNRLQGVEARAADRTTNVNTTNSANQLTANSQNVAEKQGLASDTITANQQPGATAGATAGVQQVDKDRAAGIAKNDRDNETKLIGGVIGGLATAGAALSDKRAKTDIKKDSAKDQAAFLDALEEVSYRYKDPSDGRSEEHGILAQDLEKSKIGRSVVRVGPDGRKRVDTAALTMAMAGVLAQVAREARRGRKAA